MNNKGFIATSLVYSLFLVLVVMILATLSNYVSNKTIQERYNELVKEDINNFEVKFHVYILGTVTDEGFRINPDISAQEKKVFLKGQAVLGLDSVFPSNSNFSYKVSTVKTNEKFELSYAGRVHEIKCVPNIIVENDNNVIVFSNIRKETLCYIY